MNNSATALYHEIFDRATTSIDGSAPLYFGAKILGERMIDSVAVLNEGHLAGELGFFDILKLPYLLRDSDKTPYELLKVEVNDAMSPTPNKANIYTSLQHLVGLIESNKTGVVYVVDDDSGLIGHLTLMDMVRWLVGLETMTDVSANDIASNHLVFTGTNATMGEILQLMLGHHVSRIIIREDDRLVGMIDDRGLTNFIFGSQYNKYSFPEIFDQSIRRCMAPVSIMRREDSLVDVAEKILLQQTHCVIVDADRIITPRDFVFKGMQCPCNSIEG